MLKHIEKMISLGLDDYDEIDIEYNINIRKII